MLEPTTLAMLFAWTWSLRSDVQENRGKQFDRKQILDRNEYSLYRNYFSDCHLLKTALFAIASAFLRFYGEWTPSILGNVLPKPGVCDGTLGFWFFVVLTIRYGGRGLSVRQNQTSIFFFFFFFFFFYLTILFLLYDNYFSNSLYNVLTRLKWSFNKKNKKI